MEGYALSESRFNQLRFDISEKVRLHPQQPGIGTLLELDLYPDVEIRDEGKHLKIQGYLRLNGAYLGEFGSEKTASDQAEVREDLAYVIPVEITIPTDRAELSHISAEVETFDYSVVSPFELQVEAILTIDGLLPEEEKETKPMKKEFTGKKIDRRELVQEPSFSAMPLASAEQSSDRASVAENTTKEDQFKEFLGTPSVKDESEHNADTNQVPDLHFSTNPHVGKTCTEEVSDEPTSVEYLHNLWNKRKVSSEENLAEGQFSQDQFAMEKELEKNINPAYVHSSDEARHDAQWVGWLMRSKDESFTSMRMVISQKDESIEDIADKYGLPVGQLMNINQLDDDQLNEGQVIHIPRQLQRTS